ncbi:MULTISPECIES: cytochrome P450 [unclassified Streptomyces]|uniref:cytochrome P450 n=1 Tax=unclassified Streptomyces TaxID=2593676 RepID=UPI0023670012|nr:MULTISPECIES: cytochrome P450 [unclassified Streptomyces]MDF3144119.1 cytochrome P450 [Streptomyces sp. T21Q-yed]WDF35784.1 cytochrome P450 [Streptomyces sp. T12]
MAALEPLIRRYAVEHIETLLAAGEADVNPTLCRPVSAQALAALLNLPEETARELLDLTPTAVEEMIRLDLPLHELGRMAATDVELHGRTIPRGCPVGLNFAAANRDPEAFDNPDEFVLDRSQNRNLGFGHGVHKCVGVDDVHRAHR